MKIFVIIAASALFLVYLAFALMSQDPQDPAFPKPPSSEGGITVRQYYAIHAFQGIIGTRSDRLESSINLIPNCFAIADSMIAWELANPAE